MADITNIRRQKESQRSMIRTLLVYLASFPIAIFAITVLLRFDVVELGWLFDLLLGLFGVALFPVLLIVYWRSEPKLSWLKVSNTILIFTTAFYSAGLVLLRLEIIEKKWLVFLLFLLVIQFYRFLGYLIKRFDEFQYRLLLISSIMFLCIIALLG
jgi:hypothetical protein